MTAPRIYAVWAGFILPAPVTYLFSGGVSQKNAPVRQRRCLWLAQSPYPRGNSTRQQMGIWAW